ncbi:MAG: GGDEF domain-containing protein [Proteobacteria bacterium]|nr:GGDEF domain-containing protein [Pseudomonadota bacterium]
MENEKDKTAFMQSPLLVTKATGTGDAVLLVIYPTGASMGRRFALDTDEKFIGRMEDLDIPLEGEGLSRKHARLFRDVTGWQIEDLGSTNGVYINDVKITRRHLKDGDLLRFGVAICKFLSGDNIEAAYHEEIYRMSIMDGLTGVHNKRYFLEFLERELAASTRQGTPLSLVMVDIDHFKKINDTHGHLAGDAALKEMCARLKPRIRKTDLLARYGGEEFAVVMPATDLPAALQFAEVLRALVEEEPFSYDVIKIPCTISLGLAQVDPVNPGKPDDLIERADAKLYEAKRSGRNRAIG